MKNLKMADKCPECGSTDFNWRFVGGLGVGKPAESIAYECFECEHKWEQKLGD